MLLGTELHPLADAVLTSVQSSGLRLVLTADAAAGELVGRADEVVDRQTPVAAHVRRLQVEGRVVVVVSAAEDGLAEADVGFGIVPGTGRVPWAADVLAARDRKRGGVTASPHGLYLTRIEYPAEFALPTVSSTGAFWR